MDKFNSGKYFQPYLDFVVYWITTFILVALLISTGFIIDTLNNTLPKVSNKIITRDMIEINMFMRECNGYSKVYIKADNVGPRYFGQCIVIEQRETEQ